MSANSSPCASESDRLREVPGPRRDLIGYGRHVPRVFWPEGAHVALSVAVSYEEGSELSFAAGDGCNPLPEFAFGLDPSYRDLATESMYEYGSRAGIWRLARLLDEFDLKCTFLVCAVALEQNPEVGRYIREAGHEPCCHGWRWDELWRLSRDEERARLESAVASIRQTCGERPRGWHSRLPPSVHTRELVVEEGGFVYDSDSLADDLPYFVEVKGKRHLVLPYTFVYNDVRFLPAQGYSDPGAFLDYCRRGLDYLWEEGATHPRMMSIGLHPRWIGQAGRTGALKEFIEYALAKGGVWFARRIDIADWWLEHHEEFR
jgi:peptidoglycan/xylan/chitin deacetylase (PgdA/CDA1 family)